MRSWEIFALDIPRQASQAFAMGDRAARLNVLLVGRTARFEVLFAPCLAGALSLLGCHAAPHPSADAMTAEAGAGGEPDGEAHNDNTQSALRDAANAQPLDANVPSSEVSFAKPSGATWEGTGQWRVEVKLSEPAERAVRYSLSTGGSAKRGSDYELATAVEFAAGSTAAQVLITIVDDHESEATETLLLALAEFDPQPTYSLSVADDDDDRWPTSDMVTDVDAVKAFPGENLSGLAYVPARGGTPADLWMVRNGPSQLYRLRASGGVYSAVATDNWAQGKTLVFPNGSGAPDSEGITLAEWSSPLVYVVSERDGNGGSAPTVLSYDTSASGTTLTATRAWDLSNDLRMLMLGANTGPEALSWIPDAYLTSAGFFDEASDAPYDPARYPNHAGGLFFVGIEQTGGIYAYALDASNGTATRVASIMSGQNATMALEFDRDTNYLWAWCDDTCGNHATILRVEENPASPRKGRFGVRRSLSRPSSLPNANHEGMTIAPASECVDGKKAVFWVEDGADDHVLRRGTVPCGAFLE